jgi:hypothetical protein
MRYRDTGNLHLDFHRMTNGTITYLRERYGVAFLDEVIRRTARDVYQSLRADLLAGNPEPLIEHWTYYLEREGGDFSVERKDGEVRVNVHRCPAAGYLRECGLIPDPAFRRQTTVLLDALCEGTPFNVSTEVHDELRYTLTLHRRTP